MTTTNTEERQEQREERVSDERILGRLEGRVGLLNENVQAADRRNDERYLALTAKIDAVNTNLSDKIDKTNSDLTDKIDKTNSDLTAKIDTVNTNLTNKIDKTNSDLNGRFIMLLIGVVVAIVGGYVGMAIALFQIAATR